MTGGGCQYWEMSSSTDEWHCEAQRALAALYSEHSDLCHLTEVLELSPSCPLLTGYFSGDTRAVGTGILDFQTLDKK